MVLRSALHVFLTPCIIGYILKRPEAVSCDVIAQYALGLGTSLLKEYPRFNLFCKNLSFSYTNSEHVIWDNHYTQPYH